MVEVEIEGADAVEDKGRGAGELAGFGGVVVVAGSESFGGDSDGGDDEVEDDEEGRRSEPLVNREPDRRFQHFLSFFFCSIFFFFWEVNERRGRGERYIWWMMDTWQIDMECRVRWTWVVDGCVLNAFCFY